MKERTTKIRTVDCYLGLFESSEIFDFRQMLHHPVRFPNYGVFNIEFYSWRPLRFFLSLREPHFGCFLVHAKTAKWDHAKHAKHTCISYCCK